MCIIEPGFFKTAVTSLDPLERELHRLWNQLSPEVQASYGDKYLNKCKSHFEWTVSHCETGSYILKVTNSLIKGPIILFCPSRHKGAASDNERRVRL